MRYLVGFVGVLALLVTALAGAGAQGTDEGGISPRVSERTRQQWDPKAFDVRQGSVPEVSRSRTGRDYVDGQVLRSRRGLWACSLVAGVGAVPLGLGAYVVRNTSSSDENAIAAGGIALTAVGAAMVAGGVIGMIVSGVRLGVRKRELRDWGQVQSRRPRQARWDLETSRLEF